MHTAEGSVADRGQPLSWREGAGGGGERAIGEGRRQERRSERQPCRLQRVEE